MDHRRLYKASRIVDSACKINKRAVEAKQHRSEKRKDLFLTSRNIEVSRNETKCEEKPKDVASKAKKDEFMTKFMAWKQAKQKRIEEEKKNKVKPFLSTVSHSLFAPSNHVFVPPKDLKIPTKNMTVKHEANDTKKIFKLDPPAKIKRTPLTLINNKGQKPQNIPVSKKKSGDSAVKSVVKKPSSSTKKPKLAQNPPIVSITKVNTKVNPPIVSITKVNTKVNPPLVTPKEFSQEPQFSAFVTSTTRKSNAKNSDSLSQEAEISPIYPLVQSPAKEEVKMEHEAKNVTRSKLRETRRSKRRSVAVDASHKSDYPIPVKSKVDTFEIDCTETEKSESRKNKKRSEDNVDLNTTPACDANEELTNYMSPFVTISRGKVSSRIEHEKRNSVYKLENSFCSPEESVEVRRIRETVKYFRKLLNDEIERMHSLCGTWEKYISDDGTGVIENGIDMIHAAIGQTKLLTSKKLQQFRGLIDKCEQGIAPRTGNTMEVNQKIEVDDLEGFWSMVHLQIENIDKRFNNLERWRNNNWCDPDEAIEQPKQKTIKVAKFKKTKTQKPSSLLKNILKEAQAAYKKSRRENTAVDEDVIMLSARKTRASTSKRRSSLLTPKTRLSKRKSQGSTPRNSLKLKAQRSADRLQVSARKSILKTPGTARKSQRRNVLFSEKLQFKSPDTPDEMLQVQPLVDDILESQRSLNLRTRRVLLPSDETR